MTRAGGQATVELALGMLVFITVVVFGIHFAEVGYLAMRVSQANAYAIYDATAQRANEHGSDMSKASTVPGLSTSEARKKYNDFQPNKNDNVQAKPVTQVFTDIKDMFIQCTRENSVTYDTNPAGAVGALVVPNPYDGSKGGIKCTARATISVGAAFPKQFQDDEWNLKTEHYASSKTSYTVCATPRSPNGECGQFGLLIGDFSLQGKTESKSHDLFSGGNDDYYNLVNGAMGVTACPAAMALTAATTFTPGSLDACTFQFGYQGVEKNYKQNIQSAHTGDTNWLTGGTNSKRQLHDPETYLGVKRF